MTSKWEKNRKFPPIWVPLKSFQLKNPLPHRTKALLPYCSSPYSAFVSFQVPSLVLSSPLVIYFPPGSLLLWLVALCADTAPIVINH